MSETHGADPGAVGDEDALLEALKAAPRGGEEDMTHNAENDAHLSPQACSRCNPLSARARAMQASG